MSTGNTGTDITIDEVDYIDEKGTCFRIVGESPVSQYERIPLPDLKMWEGGGWGKGRRKIKMSERSQLDQERVRAITSGEPSSSQQAGTMTNEQMMQFYNSMTPEQLQYYGGYDTQYGGGSSMTLSSQQEMEIMGQVYGETMSNQPSSMASYNPELDEGSALAQQFGELWWQSSEMGKKKRSKK
ncbi:hypothetical protein L198_08093 [Cryptococcus wingfieldii CBS 7118]|uniref:Uncharacterized protein n=1 Tax=Cryptococcus wingfieldii CBS 7118 TaxID=1295528 RepID=A0A1E3HJ79_9TREE|nr:hypothetical protein L198_08093 [Cryptococcus wingfieldii CBS 7118]ODN76409.1 hypothetical protein L198_08093 [Cryptococcus wingfieldii CBS 7118]